MITIAILAYNEEKNIRKTINSVLKQKKIDIEKFFIVVNGTTDDTVAEVNRVRDDRIKVMILEEKGKVRALNYFSNYISGLTLKSKYIVFIDADIILVDNLSIYHLINSFSNRAIKIVSGNCIPFVGKESNYLLGKIYYIEYLIRKYSSYNTVRGYFYALEIEAFKKVRIPELILSDDAYLAYLFDGHIKLNKNIEVLHRYKLNFFSDLKRQMRSKIIVRQMNLVISQRQIKKYKGNILPKEKFKRKYRPENYEILNILKNIPKRFWYCIPFFVCYNALVELFWKFLLKLPPKKINSVLWR